MDPSIIVAAIALGGAFLSLSGTIIMALANIKNTQIQASDEIASGSMKLLEQYRQEIAKNKMQREEMQKEIDDLTVQMNKFRQWQADVIDFVIPFIEGSKANEKQLIDADIVPAYQLPPLPNWLSAS